MPSPFDLDNNSDYLRWRDAKLEQTITNPSELVVELRDPANPTDSERKAILDRCGRCNMAIYASNMPLDQESLQRFGLHFGLTNLDANWLAGEDGVSAIRVANNGTRTHYIPYTDRPIKWHTDGYYNTPESTIRGMLLHCVRPAASGGENRLMDHELLYLLLRDQNPEHIRALSAPDAMTIPERIDEIDGIRAAQSGPVFSVDQSGNLHMRYTARTRSIVWKDDNETKAAINALEETLSGNIEFILHAKLERGMGLICNNVLHDRAGFADDSGSPRLLYRARYKDRVSPS